MTFFETVVPPSRSDHWTRPSEQVPAWLADRRLERREEARRRVRHRTGERHET